LHRHVDLDGRRRPSRPAASRSRPLPRRRRTRRGGPSGCRCLALPSGAPRGGDHIRGLAWASVGGLGPGRESDLRSSLTARSHLGIALARSEEPVLPLIDEYSPRRFPILTIALILLCVGIFAYQKTLPDNGTIGSSQAFECTY